MRSNVWPFTIIGILLFLGVLLSIDTDEAPLKATTRTTVRSTTTDPSVATLTGTFTLSEPQTRPPAEPCFGTGGYDDIREGTQVVVRDGDGSVLATGRLGPGNAGSDSTGPGSLWFCVFEFDVEIPTDSAFYEVEVAHRGGITYSQDQLRAASWAVTLELG